MSRYPLDNIPTTDGEGFFWGYLNDTLAVVVARTRWSKPEPEPPPDIVLRPRVNNETLNEKLKQMKDQGEQDV